MNRFLIFYICMFLIGLSNLSFAQNTDSLIIKSYMNQAYDFYKEKKYEKCRDFSLKVLDIDSTYGDAYILIGTAYIGSVESCGEDHFSKHIIYCLAVDKFQKAKKIDKSVTDKSDQLIEIYSKYFPSRETIFIGPIEGQRYKVKCWINEETIVRFSD